MKDAHRSTTPSLAQRLREDAMLIDDRPSDAARGRLRAALDAAPGARAAATRPARPRLRPMLPTAAAAAAAVLLWASGPWSHTTDSTQADDASAGGPVPEILASLLSVHPSRAMEFVAERPLRGELDALASDAVAVADAVLRRIPRPLVPNRRKDGVGSRD